MTRPHLPATLPLGRGLRPRGAAARRWATRRWTAWRWTADAAIAAAVTAIQVGGTDASAGRHPGYAAAGIAAYLLLTVSGAALIARRRYQAGLIRSG